MTNIELRLLQEIRDNTKQLKRIADKLDVVARLMANKSEADTPQTDAEIPKNALRSDCTGCRFIGWYDTEFPCVNCIRKTKDYYTPEYTERSE